MVESRRETGFFPGNAFTPPLLDFNDDRGNKDCCENGSYDNDRSKDDIRDHASDRWDGRTASETGLQIGAMPKPAPYLLRLRADIWAAPIARVAYFIFWKTRQIVIDCHPRQCKIKKLVKAWMHQFWSVQQPDADCMNDAKFGIFIIEVYLAPAYITVTPRSPSFVRFAAKFPSGQKEV